MDNSSKRSITDRLKSLGLGKPAREFPQPTIKLGNGIESVIPGSYLSTPLGDVFV